MQNLCIYAYVVNLRKADGKLACSLRLLFYHIGIDT